MTDNPPKSLAARMVAVMGDVPTMIKNGQNMAQKYAYVTAEDVKAAIRPLLKRHGIAVFSSMVDVTREMSVNKNSTTVVTVIAKMEFALVCAETGELMRCFWVGEANDYADKAVNKAATAAEKYWLINTFLLSTTEALDADEETVETPAPNYDRYPPEPAGKVTKSHLAAIRTLATQLWGPDDFVAEGAMYVQETYHRELKDLTDEQAKEMIQDLNDRLKLATVTP